MVPQSGCPGGRKPPPGFQSPPLPPACAGPSSWWPCLLCCDWPWRSLCGSSSSRKAPLAAPPAGPLDQKCPQVWLPYEPFGRKVGAAWQGVPLPQGERGQGAAVTGRPRPGNLGFRAFLTRPVDLGRSEQSVPPWALTFSGEDAGRQVRAPRLLPTSATWRRPGGGGAVALAGGGGGGGGRAGKASRAPRGWRRRTRSASRCGARGFPA